MMLIIKPFRVTTDGFPGYTYYAKSRGQALAKAWSSYLNYRDVSFGDFLKLAKCTQEERCGRFGEYIEVGGRPAYWISCDRQYIQFAYPDSDQILNTHPLDVQPPEARRGTPYYAPSPQGTDHGNR